MRRTAAILLVFSLTCLVSCTRQKQYAQSANENQKQGDQSADCSSSVRVPYNDFEIVICSNGDQFISKKPKQWSGDNIKIYKQKDKETTLLRNFEETAFGSTYGVNIEAKDDVLNITIFSDHFPDWQVVPLFTEVVRLDTGVSTITPHVPVPSYDPKDVEKLWADINKNEADMFPGQSREDTHGQKFFDLAYGNLFRLRDYAFRNPEAIEKKLMELGKWDWNDGEVAEVYSQILSQVSYMKGKQVVLK